MMFTQKNVLAYLSLAILMASPMVGAKVILSYQLQIGYKNEKKRNSIAHELKGLVTFSYGSEIPKNLLDLDNGKNTDGHYLDFDLTKTDFDAAAASVGLGKKTLPSLKISQVEKIIDAFLYQKGVKYKATIKTGPGEIFENRDAKIFALGDDKREFKALPDYDEIDIILHSNHSLLPLYVMISFISSILGFVYIFRIQSLRLDKIKVVEQAKRELLGYRGK